jgi:TonB-linked SusC/RagA family outer membrane protein
VFDISDSYADWRVLGYFGRINYNYKEKYFLEANGRYDGSSRFPAGSRFLFLPSFSAGWNVAKEPFFSKYESLSILKLRASWGEIGNQNTADYYPAIPGYEDFNASWINLDNDQRYLSLRPGQLVSNSFTWEKVRTTNLGVDIGLFRDKLSASFDIYKRETIGMLAAGLDLPKILGTEAPDQNIADLETNGWEFEIGWKDKKGDVRYGLNFNLFDNNSKITNFLNESGLIDRNYIGREIGEIWGYVTDGYYTIDDFVEGTLDADLSGPFRQLKNGVPVIENAPVPYPGDVKYADLNGDGVINAGNSTLVVELDEAGNPIPRTGPGDRQIIGNSTRRYQFGLNGYVGYKGLDLSFVLSGVGKRDLWRANNGDIIWPFPSLFDHIYKHQLDYWTPDNQDAYYPRVYGNPVGNTGSNYGNSRQVQTKYLSDESYLRIQNITIGFSPPQSVIKRLKVDNLRIFLSGNNLFTFDNLVKGLDPDQTSNGYYPIMRNYSFGLNLTF